MDHVVKSLKITKMLRNLKKVQFLKNVSKKSSGTNPILVKNLRICINFMKIHLNSCKNGFQIKDMGKSSCKKLRNVFLNIFYRMVLLKTPLNDVFCMEMPISRKKNVFYGKNTFFYIWGTPDRPPWRPILAIRMPLACH